MAKEITIGKDTFGYYNNGSYIRIMYYSHADGTLIFSEEADGKKYFHIHIPEVIDGLPVLIVNKLFLEVDYRHHYRHNGLDVVMLHLPENTAFSGLKKISTGMNSVFVPNHTEVYYPREKQLLKVSEGAYHFFGEKIDDTSCRIFAITRDNCIKKDWVWSQGSQKLTPNEKLVIPSRIGEYSVKEISPESTDALPNLVKEIHIPEGIEVIGENCFSGLPFIEDVYLPKSLKAIGAGAFGYYICSQYTETVPTLTVHYYDTMPEIGEKAFHRQTDREIYEEYADWGNMYSHTRHISHEVVYEKNQ